ncbi:MerR family transcriptional regulator [Microbacterium azadirachtae]|uniref:MerR family transcriptional regulator n=1 Tax=Microbacterium azadirachtae TaxID=582680 RepID=UPI003F751DFB
MRISEAAAAIGTPARMLRYYEQQGLLRSSRAANGYRNYSDEQVEHARHVRALVEAGLSTRMIKIVLDLEGSDLAPQARSCSRALAEELARELHIVQDRIACLEKSRAAVVGYLRSTDHADLVPPTSP